MLLHQSVLFLTDFHPVNFYFLGPRLSNIRKLSRIGTYLVLCENWHLVRLLYEWLTGFLL